MEPAPANQPPEGGAICPRHGLPFNPKLSSGCVRCRRTTDEAPRPWFGPVAALGLLIGAVGLSFPLRSALRAYLAPPAPSGAAPMTPSHQRCMAASDNVALAAAARDCAEACEASAGASCRRLAGLCSPAAPFRLGEGCGEGSAALLDRGCKAGDTHSCLALSDQNKAEILWKACESGLGRPCSELVPLCDPQRPALGDGAPSTAWAFFASQGARDACAGGAARLLDRACSRGDWASCEHPSIKDRYDQEKLRGLLEGACDRADALACRRLAAVIGPGDPSTVAALLAYASALETCSGEACALVRRWRERVAEERPKATQKAAANHEESCAAGRVSSCWEAAETYTLGDGIQPDPRRAAELNDKARTLLREGCKTPGSSCASGDTLKALEECDRGGAMACLAVVRTQGGGPSGEAAPLFRRGVRGLRAECDSRKGGACWILGDLHAQGALPGGEGAQVDMLRKGCDARHGLSCNDLAQRLDTGAGVAKDRPGAERLFRKAAEMLAPSCEGGDGASCRALSSLYAEGKGVVRDQARADEYAKRAR